MAESLESDKINKILEGIDSKTLQQLIKTINENPEIVKPTNISPSSNNFTQDVKSKTENFVLETNGPLENETNNEELSPDNFAAASTSEDVDDINDDLPADESKLAEFKNDYKEEHNVTPEHKYITPAEATDKEKPKAEEKFSEQSHQIETAVGSNINQDIGSSPKMDNEVSLSKAALFQSPSAIADNMEALHIHQKTNNSTATLITPSDLSVVNFYSAVPAIQIPLSNVGLYLPKGKILTDTDAPIPLPYKPMLVIKDQVAAIVFEHGSNESYEKENDSCKILSKKEEVVWAKESGICGECGKNLDVVNDPFSDSIECNVTPNKEKGQLDIAWKNASFKSTHDLGTLSNQKKQQQQPPPQQPPQQQPPPQQQQQQQQPPLQQPPTTQQQQQRFPTQPFVSSEFTHEQAANHQPSGYASALSAMPRRSSVPPNFQESPGCMPQYLSAKNDPANSQSNHLPGLQSPVWAKDEDCKSCLHCGNTFTITRRKHHCRGCGKIFCSDCCNQLAQLPYLDFKIARICVYCTQAIKAARAAKVKRQQKGIQSESQNSAAPRSISMSNGALLYIPPGQVNNSIMENGDTAIPAQSQNQQSNFMVPESVTETGYADGLPTTNFMPDPHVAVQNLSSSNLSQAITDTGLAFGFNEIAAPEMLAAYDSPSCGYLALKAPVRPAGRTITWTDGKESKFGIEDQTRRYRNIAKELKNTEGVLVQAAVELSVRIKKIRVVVKQGVHEAWFLRSHGFKSCGQKEIAFLLEKRINEEVFPFEMLKIYRTFYSITLNQGEHFEHGNYLAFNSPLLGNEDNKGFLFVSSTMLPSLVQQFSSEDHLLYGILVKQSELPCAKYLPTRLLIALGVQQQCYPCPALSSRDRPSVCNVEPNELFFSTFVALNKFLNHKTPQALIPGVHILRSGGKVVLELPFAYQTEIISIFDSLFVDEDKPVTIPIAGDLVLDASGHFMYSPSSVPSAQRGFVVLQNNNEHEGPGNQYLAFSSILLVLTFGEVCSSRTKFGVTVIEDGIKVTLVGSQAKEIRQSIYQGTNCTMYVGNADSPDQFILRWTSESGGSVISRPKTIVQVRQDSNKSYKGYRPPVPSSLPARTIGGQTNVIIDRLKTRETKNEIQQKIIGDSEEVIRKLENDVRQACIGSLLTFANRLLPNAEKRLNLTLCLRPGYKKWGLGPTNQPINLARSLQLALSEIQAPETNSEIVLVFNITLQKIN